jgi:hypothetical protein
MQRLHSMLLSFFTPAAIARSGIWRGMTYQLLHSDNIDTSIQ